MHHDEKEWDKPEEFNPGGLCDPHPLLAQGMSGWVQQERLSPGGCLVLRHWILLLPFWGIGTSLLLQPLGGTQSRVSVNSGRSQAEGITLLMPVVPLPLAGRFLDEQGQHIHSPSPSYLPFGAGIRVCLGKVLAKMELFLFLAWVLQRFTLECPEDQPLPSLEGKFGVVLQVQKFQVKARLREAWRAAS